MRKINVHGPQGCGPDMAKIAFEVGILQISLNEARVMRKGKEEFVQDVMEFETTTSKTKEFIEHLMNSSLYDPSKFNFSTLNPESIFATEPPEKQTNPIIRPTTDVYQDLWQYSIITLSLIGRTLIASLLAAYGMQRDYMPMIIAGLLFLPFHHHLLGMCLGAGVGEWRLFRQALMAFVVSTAFVILGGVGVGLVTEPGVAFTEFKEIPVAISFGISVIIGIAAGLASVDDAGKRELIGLAATATLSVFPIWFGLKFVYGFDPSDNPVKLFLVFLMGVVTFLLSAWIIFKLMGMRGRGIARFLKSSDGRND